jgi:hypothetical protein
VKNNPILTRPHPPKNPPQKFKKILPKRTKITEYDEIYDPGSKSVVRQNREIDFRGRGRGRGRIPTNVIGRNFPSSLNIHTENSLQENSFDNIFQQNQNLSSFIPQQENFIQTSSNDFNRIQQSQLNLQNQIIESDNRTIENISSEQILGDQSSHLNQQQGDQLSQQTDISSEQRCNCLFTTIDPCKS